MLLTLCGYSNKHAFFSHLFFFKKNSFDCAGWKIQWCKLSVYMLCYCSKIDNILKRSTFLSTILNAIHLWTTLWCVSLEHVHIFRSEIDITMNVKMLQKKLIFIRKKRNWACQNTYPFPKKIKFSWSKLRSCELKKSNDH